MGNADEDPFDQLQALAAHRNDNRHLTLHLVNGLGRQAAHDRVVSIGFGQPRSGIELIHLLQSINPYGTQPFKFAGNFDSHGGANQSGGPSLVESAGGQLAFRERHVPVLLLPLGAVMPSASAAREEIRKGFKGAHARQRVPAPPQAW